MNKNIIDKNNSLILLFLIKFYIFAMLLIKWVPKELMLTVPPLFIQSTIQMCIRDSPYGNRASVVVWARESLVHGEGGQPISDVYKRQIQNDLSTLLVLKEDSAYPWVARFDDLETFLLTLIAKRKAPIYFVNFISISTCIGNCFLCQIFDSEIYQGNLENYEAAVKADLNGDDLSLIHICCPT